MNKRRRYLAKRRRLAVRHARRSWIRRWVHEPIPPAGRLTGDRSNLQSWIRRYFGDYQPQPWQLEVMRDIVDGRRVFTLEQRPAGRRFVGELLREYAQGVDWASGPDRTATRSTFGQQPDYPVARAEADQEPDQNQKPHKD